MQPKYCSLFLCAPEIQMSKVRRLCSTVERVAQSQEYILRVFFLHFMDDLFISFIFNYAIQPETAFSRSMRHPSAVIF